MGWSMSGQRGSAARRWLVNVASSPWRYIIVIGICWMGGALSAYLIALDFIRCGYVTIDRLALHIAVGTVGGLMWGMVTWPILKIDRLNRRT